MLTRPFHEGKRRNVSKKAARGLAFIGAVVFSSVLALVAPASAADRGALLSAPNGGALVSAATASPTMSPSAKQVRYAASMPVSCATGNLCVVVWDWPRWNSGRADAWKVFDLYYCNRYYLYDWYDGGVYYNQQTGGVTVTFYGASSVIRSFTATGGGEQDWTPVYSIRNC